MPESVYIHIPFCRRKCNYCTFASYPALNLKDEYLNSLYVEISKRYKGDSIKTLYIGGGTPSLLSASDLEKISSLFDISECTEITCEANPENLSYSWLKDIYRAGVNRLSLGVQSFDDKILEKIGRKHSVKDAFSAVKNAKKAGFTNMNIDLIYGLPGQSMENFVSSVITACELDIEHISSYGLKIEDGSFFFSNPPDSLPDEEMQSDMYLKLIDLTEKYGYNHYEVSNFAKKGFESKHNLNYWNADNYYGFGCAASGFEDNMRYSHTNSISEYIKNPVELKDIEYLTTQMQLEETIFLGLRKAEGININKINERFNIDFEQKYNKILKKYQDLLVKTKNGIAFSNKGFLVSNYILSDFIE